jgi:hypothetical protein
MSATNQLPGTEEPEVGSHNAVRERDVLVPRGYCPFGIECAISSDGLDQSGQTCLPVR